MKQKHIYLSGPMTGLPNDNAEEFYKAENHYQALKCQVTNPHRIGMQYKLRHDIQAIGHLDYMHILLQDLTHMLIIDEVVLLPNWQTSRGALIELHWAKLLCKPVVHAYTDEPFTYQSFVEIQQLVAPKNEEQTEFEKLLVK